MKLSVVTTLYHSASYLTEFYRRVRNMALQLTHEYEIIFVNDGSPDHSLQIALQLKESDVHVTIIDLSCNSGHHRAMMTGLQFASGDFIFLIDCDLEEEPEWIIEFYKKLLSESADVVYGIQAIRKGNWFERISGNCFYFLMNKLSNINIPSNLVTARLMTKRYVQSLLSFREREIYLPGLLALCGYKQIPIMVKKHYKGHSTYNFRKKIALFVNSITSFSDKPLICIFYTGFTISLLAGVYIFYLLLRKIMFNIEVSGWASIIVSVWFLGGIIILFMGIIGVYLSKIFLEVKNRPYTIIRRIYHNEDHDTKCNEISVLEQKTV